VIIINTGKGQAGQIISNIHFKSTTVEISGLFILLNSRQYLPMQREAFKKDCFLGSIVIIFRFWRLGYHEVYRLAKGIYW
jgi:hypothetical protein